MGHYASEMDGSGPIVRGGNGGGPQPPEPPRPTEAHLVFRQALSNHYRAERDRSEECLGDIVTILQNRQTQHGDTIDQILMRLVKHYDRK